MQQGTIDPMTTRDFQKTVWDYYMNHQRSLPWRGPNVTPYEIMVSEIMLQQTQVSRVIEKYAEFLERFPNIQELAKGPLEEVLRIWLGLGYNRRAKFLWQAAKVVMDEFDGIMPNDTTSLTRLPGIGANTAGAIMAYAYNQPVVYIETNIRTVYMHHYFPNAVLVTDAQILEKVSETLDTANPREWYWALMDYGTHLKATQPKHLHRAKSHTKQTKFEGSLRQVRGRVLRVLAQGATPIETVLEDVADDRTRLVVQDLVSEKLISEQDGMLVLGSALE